MGNRRKIIAAATEVRILIVFVLHGFMQSKKGRKMIKKKIVVLLCCFMVTAMLVACGNAGADVGVTASSDADVMQESTSREEAASTEEEEQAVLSDDRWAYAQVAEAPEGLNDYYVEDKFGYSVYLPKAFNQTEGYGYSAHVPKINSTEQTDISDCEVIYVTQYSGEVGDDEQKERIDMSQYEDSTDIFDLLIGNIEHELWAGLGFLLEDYSVEILETKEINGIEMTKYQGVLNVGYDLSEDWKWTYHITAWGIKAEGTPVLICAVDTTEEQSEHEYWAEKIDDIVETFRNGSSAE